MARRVVCGIVGLIGLIGVTIAWRNAATPDVRVVALPPHSGVLAVDGQSRRAFVGGPNGRVQIFDTAAATLLRTVAVDQSPDSVFVTGAVVAARQAHLFVVTQHYSSNAGTRGAVVMLDARRRRVLHTIPIAAGHGATPVALDAHTDRVFMVVRPPFPGRKGQLSVLDALSGRPVRRVALDGWPSDLYDLVIDQDTGDVFLADTDTGVVGAFDGRDGRLLWRRRLGQVAVRTPHRLVRTGMPAVDGRRHRVFLADVVAGTVGAYDTRDGRLVGMARLSRAGATTMVANLRAGRVFAIQPGWIHVLDATSGRLLRAIGVGPRFRSVYGLQLAIDDASNRAIIVDPRSNEAGVLDGTTGRLLHTSVLPPITLDMAPVTDGRGEIVVMNAGLPDRAGTLDNPASISVLDDATGAIRRIIPVGRGPGELAIDEQAGRAIVLNDACPAGLIRSADPWRWVPGRMRHRLPLSPPAPSRGRVC